MVGLPESVRRHLVVPECSRGCPASPAANQDAERLERLGIQVDAGDAKEPEDVGDEESEGHRYVAHAE
jgi:hypothetical protein